MRFTTLAGLAVLALAVAACGGPTTAPPISTPTVTPVTSGEPPTAPAETPAETPPASAPASAAPGTPAAATGEPSAGPSASLTPSVDSLKVKRSADCLGNNGTSTVGYVKITWTASGTTGVRISIDPPSADTAYDFGYGDYPASGSAEVPFACDPPNHDANGDYHLYVVTTLHDKGYYFWRLAKVYQVASPSPTP